MTCYFLLNDKLVYGGYKYKPKLLILLGIVKTVDSWTHLADVVKGYSVATPMSAQIEVDKWSFMDFKDIRKY